MAIDTSGLSGYAKAWADSYNQTGSTTAANAAANQATYGSSSGPTTAAQIDSALSGTSFPSGTVVYGGDGASYSYGGGGGSTTTRNDGTPTYTQKYAPKRNDYGNTTDYYKAYNDYSLSLLNPYNLPGFYMEDGSPYSYLNVPQEGKSHSNDIIAPPQFVVDEQGNIQRTDFTVSGETTSFIPNVGGWRQSADGRYDQELGDAYSRQISPVAAETRMIRGDRIGTVPNWYDPSATQTWLDLALGVTQGKGDYKSLLPADDWYSGITYSGGGGGGNAAITPATTATAAPAVEITPVRTKATPWSGKFWAEDIDIDAELKALGHEPSMYTEEQKMAILSAIRQLQGGR